MRHMSEYKGWEVAVTPREEALMFWRALIEIWPSGRDWRTSRPRLVSFRQSAASQDEILKAASLHIEEWINIACGESADHR
jgi:hypothetical protein